jgi:hypothetical protein
MSLCLIFLGNVGRKIIFNAFSEEKQKNSICDFMSNDYDKDEI